VAVVQLTLVAVVPVMAPVAVVRSTPVAVVPVVATVAVVQWTPVAVFPVAPVVSIDSSGWWLITRWLSFDHSSSGCRLIESVAVVPVVPMLSIAPVVAVVRSLRWWLSFDRSGQAVVRSLRWWLSFDGLLWLWFDHAGGCQAVVPVAPGAVDQVAPGAVVAVDRLQ